jgi:hypothetical protein
LDGRVETVRVLVVEHRLELSCEEIRHRFAGVVEAVDGHHCADARFEGGGSWGQVAAEGHADECES